MIQLLTVGTLVIAALAIVAYNFISPSAGSGTRPTTTKLPPGSVAGGSAPQRERSTGERVFLSLLAALGVIILSVVVLVGLLLFICTAGASKH